MCKKTNRKVYYFFDKNGVLFGQKLLCQISYIWDLSITETLKYYKWLSDIHWNEYGIPQH